MIKDIIIHETTETTARWHENASGHARSPQAGEVKR